MPNEKKPEYVPAVLDGVVKFCARREFKGEVQEGFAVDFEMINEKGRPVILRGFSDKEVKLGPVKGMKVNLGVTSCRF